MRSSDDIQRLIGQSSWLTSAALDSARERLARDEALRRAVDQARSFDSEYQRAIQNAAAVSSLSQVSQVLMSQLEPWSLISAEAEKLLAAQSLSQVALEISQDPERWASLTARLDNQPSLVDVAAAAIGYEVSLAAVTARLADVGLLDRNPGVAALVLGPYQVALSAGASMADELIVARSVTKRSSLAASLALTADLAQTCAVEVVEMDEPATDDAEEMPLAITTAPRIIRRELVATKGIPATSDLAVLRPYSPAVQLAYRAQRISTLLGGCNEEWELRHNVQLFRTTTAVFVAGAQLPFTTVVDKDSLGSFVDCLYFMLYEGAGGDHLRYREANLMNDEECKVIWVLKALRNYYLRHDPDHGDARKIRGKREKLLTAFRWLGISSYPRSVADFRLIHERLLAEVEAFLERLARRAGDDPQAQYTRL